MVYCAGIEPNGDLMHTSTSTSWTADLSINRARRAGLTGFTGRAPLRGLLTVSAAGWSWMPDERAARRGVPPVRPEDGWALVVAEWPSRYFARATIAKRSGDMLVLDVPDGYGLENHLVDAAAGYPRPGNSGLWIYGRCAGVVVGLLVAVPSFLSAARIQNGAHVVPGMLVLFALGVLGLFVTGYAVASLFGKVGKRR